MNITWRETTPVEGTSGLDVPLTGAERYQEMDLLRLATAGSVDDGKSTLIGRLLYDTRSIFEDQLEAVERASRKRGEDEVNLALLTDGLRAEREQNITIDVAYRYFATPRRKFIVADTPGHLQYTRNMVTGASTADLAIVLIDARKGVQTQSRRHGFISSLLKIPHLVVAVNKMDLVDYREERFGEIVSEYRQFAERLELQNLAFIPLSALKGDNVVERGQRMPWYGGPTLLELLETVPVGTTQNLPEFRFPVQYVIRPNQDFRGFAGRVASGTISPGDEVVALPSRQGSRVRTVEMADGPLAEAVVGDSVVLTLEDEIDISRGEMLVRRGDGPSVGDRFESALCWMGEHPLDPGVPYLLLHATRQVQAFVSRVLHRVDVDTLRHEPAASLALNELGRVEIRTAKPIVFDGYDSNRVTGSFVLVDPYSNVTVAAGMIGEETRPSARPTSPEVVWEEWNIGRPERERRNGHHAAVLWLTGLSGAGKSTLARALERDLFTRGYQTFLLDGDQLRHGLCGDLGFSEAERTENLRRAGEAARLFFEAGAVVICAFVSPLRANREAVRALFPADRFFEVHVDADVETCRARDPKGLYARALAGEIRGFTGIDAPYEAPEEPELYIDTRKRSVTEGVEAVVARLAREGILRS